MSNYELADTVNDLFYMQKVVHAWCLFQIFDDDFPPPLTGTWVTFGGQISDEVRLHVRSIHQVTLDIQVGQYSSGYISISVFNAQSAAFFTE